MNVQTECETMLNSVVPIHNQIMILSEECSCGNKSIVASSEPGGKYMAKRLHDAYILLALDVVTSMHLEPTVNSAFKELSQSLGTSSLVPKDDGDCPHCP
eukprot:756762_1